MARTTASRTAGETMPYESRPTSAAANVRRAYGTWSTATYEGHAEVGVEEDADMREVPQLEAWERDAGVFGVPYAMRRNMWVNVAAAYGR
ncbi:hypothetical protein [Streptomyces prunicolor]|uniref:Uncharacterized protein n=1 Tax=Streptomyces prunicolor TaxID=67348 RepID=A0ABU4FLM6_9ACTN|nr:hypothetical protein [Streptomyces prunicolor]MDV7221521.1 hypothetical protein [Streptomyces prunicolor]